MSRAHERTIVMMLRAAFRLAETRFSDPRRGGDVGADAPGWRRDHGDGEHELWILPAYWRSIFEPDIDAIEAAQALDRIGLLRRQDDGNLQAVAKVGGRTARVYAIDGAALAEWKVTARGFGGYGQSDTLELGSAPPFALVAEDDTADLPQLLQRGAEAALRKGIEVLAMSPDPSDRHYATVLRAQSAFGNTLLSVQLRVDEAKLKARRSAELLPKIMEQLEIEKKKLAEIDLRRGKDKGASVAMMFEEPGVNE